VSGSDVLERESGEQGKTDNTADGDDCQRKDLLPLRQGLAERRER